MSTKYSLPSQLKKTLQELEGTITDWEKIDPPPTQPEPAETLRAEMEKELQQKAKHILDQLKAQIEELS